MPRQTRRYQWPTWSTDGRLAYFSISLDDGQFETGAYISADGSVEGDLVYAGPEAFNYAYWAPGNCDMGEQCRDLSVLLSSQSRGMFVELIRDGLAEVESITAGIGGPPFYYSWSPDGGRMLWQRNNQRFDIYDANTDRVTDTLVEMPGTIFAPAWSPVDDRLLFGAVNANDTTDLVIVGNDERQVLETGFEGLISFGWSPDGNLVAYREGFVKRIWRTDCCGCHHGRNGCAESVDRDYIIFLGTQQRTDCISYFGCPARFL